MRSTASRILVLAISLCMTLPACASGGGSPRRANATPAPPPPPVGFHGPKTTIAIAKFDAHGAFLGRYGSWEPGGGLAAQLATALEQSNRFVVVERPDLGYVLKEQRLAAEGLTTAATSPTPGRLLGAQLLIRGSVTEFDESTSGGGLSLGGITPRGLGGALSPRLRVGHVAIDFRLIDTTTGRIVSTHTVQKRLTRVSVAAAAAKARVSGGADFFKKTALGDATRDAIQEAVSIITSAVETVPWQAVIAKVKGGQVYLNAGSTANIHVGDQLTVRRVVDRIVDPVTQEVLGVEEATLGAVEVVHVAPRYATARFMGSSQPRVGDVLRFSGRGARLSARSPR